MCRQLRYSRVSLSVILSFLVWCGWSPGQETEEAGEIVVTASRDAEDPWDAPASTLVITRQDMEKAGASGVPDALEKIAGIHIRTATATPVQAQIDLRGFGEQSHGKTLVLLDGRRLNNPDMAQIDWLQIPVENIERIEVVRGAQTVLYGDNAVGGVINIITKRGKGRPEGELSVRTGSEGSVDWRAGWKGTSGPLSYALSGQWISDNGWRQRSSWWRTGTSLNLTYEASNSFRLSLDAAAGVADYQLPGFLTETQMRTDPRQAGNPSDDVRTDNRSVNLTAEGQIAAGHRWKASLWAAERENRNNMDSYWAWSDVTVARFGFSPQYIFESSACGRQNKLIAGVDYERCPVDSTRFDSRDRHNATAFSTVVKETLGAYIQDEIRLTDAFLFKLGYRYESGSISAYDNETAFGAEYADSKEFSGSAATAGLVYQWGNKGKAYLSWGRVFRYPFTDEIAYYQGFLGGPWPGTIFFNKDLRPEQGHSIELGGQFRPADAVEVGLTVFSIDLTDEIYYNPLTGLNENLYRTRRRGIELSCAYAPTDRLSLNLFYTLIDPEFRDGPYAGRTVPLVPSQKATASVSFSLPAGISVEASVTGTGRAYLGSDFDNDQRQLAGYGVADILCHFRPAGLRQHQARFFAGVRNVFDEQYCTLGFDWGFMNVFYPAQGRTFVAGGSFAF